MDDYKNVHCNRRHWAVQKIQLRSSINTLSYLLKVYKNQSLNYVILPIDICKYPQNCIQHNFTIQYSNHLFQKDKSVVCRQKCLAT